MLLRTVAGRQRTSYPRFRASYSAHQNPYPYPALQLNTGSFMPLVGLGTYLAPAGEVGQSVKTALAVGYRHIDCARVYGNEAEIGSALREVYSQGKIKRGDIFITSKLSSRAMDPSGVEAQLDKTLQDLQTKYLDLYLVHQPVVVQEVDGKPLPKHGTGWGLQDVWRAMEAVLSKGKTKAIGVSNFPTVVINDLLCYAKVVPAVQQIERHPWLVQKKHVDYCRRHGIQITAYASLGAPGLMTKVRPDALDLLNAPPVTALVKKYNKTPAQILIRWSIDTNVIAIPKSVKEERLKENFAVWDFKLLPDEIQTLSNMNQNTRCFEQEWHNVPTFT